MGTAPAAGWRETRRFTVDEVERMVEVGVLDEDEHVELIEGELLVVTPQGPSHGNTIEWLLPRLMAEYGVGWSLRPQLPLRASDISLPEPDLAVVRVNGVWLREQRHPRGDEIELAIEVVVTTHREAARKRQVYAQAGVPAYWIVDQPSRQIVEHRSPMTSGEWGRIQVYGERDHIPFPALERIAPVASLLLPSGPATSER